MEDLEDVRGFMGFWSSYLGRSRIEHKYFGNHIKKLKQYMTFKYGLIWFKFSNRAYLKILRVKKW